MKPADRGWLALFAGITGYELAAIRRGWELLSQAMDRYRGEGRIRDDYSQIVRWLIDGVIAYLALHLMRRWPPKLDPLTQLARRLTRRGDMSCGSSGCRCCR